MLVDLVIAVISIDLHPVVGGAVGDIERLAGSVDDNDRAVVTRFDAPALGVAIVDRLSGNRFRVVGPCLREGVAVHSVPEDDEATAGILNIPHLVVSASAIVLDDGALIVAVEVEHFP